MIIRTDEKKAVGNEDRQIRFQAPRDKIYADTQSIQNSLKRDRRAFIGGRVRENDDTTLGFAYVSGGSFTIAAGDDGIHADETLAVTAGTIEITKSYEGLEALSIEISGGNIKLAASDDGLNAAGGTDSSGYDGDRPRQQRERRGFVHARVGVPKSGHKLARSRERAEVYVVRGQFVKLGNGVT